MPDALLEPEQGKVGLEQDGAAFNVNGVNHLSYRLPMLCVLIVADPLIREQVLIYLAKQRVLQYFCPCFGLHSLVVRPARVRIHLLLRDLQKHLCD